MGSVCSATSRAVTLPSGMNSIADLTGTGGSTLAAGAPASPTPPPAPTAPALPQILAEPPVPQTVAPIPDTGSPAVMEAARRAQQLALGTAGRSATILTSMAQRAPRASTGGTADYSKSTLAAG